MNKTNKKNRLMLKESFSKDELLILKKFPCLINYNVPYPILIRSYKRYINNVGEYISIKRIPTHWFKKDRQTFSMAVKMYIESKLHDYIYKENTRGYNNLEIVKISKLDKYLNQVK